jgi:hypothetical protein
MSVKMDVVLNHLDKEGNVKSTFSKPCDSFNYNFMRYIANSFGAAALFNVIDTGNVSRAISHAGLLNIITASGVTTTGIRLGTNGTTSTPADYNLGALIANGLGDGVLAYGGVIAPTVDVVGNVIRLHIKRTFINAGATGITVRELDLVSSAGGFNVQYLRDSIPDQVIPSLDGVAVEIIIQVTV